MSDAKDKASPPDVKSLQVAGCYWWLFKSADGTEEVYRSSKEEARATWNSIKGARTYYVWQLVGIKGPESGVPPAYDENVYRHLAGGG